MYTLSTYYRRTLVSSMEVVSIEDASIITGELFTDCYNHLVAMRDDMRYVLRRLLK